MENISKSLDIIIVPELHKEKQERWALLRQEKDNLKEDLESPNLADIQYQKLLDMAYDNAKIALEEEIELIVRDDKRTFGANEELGKMLNIPNLKRIEIFDNAHLFGTFTVSGMVVFTNGKPDKKEYRKYKINFGSKDDYHTMQEVIYRRYYRVLHDKLERPDLIIVDGGISQIHAAKEILDSLYLDIPVIGLKKNDKHTTTSLISEDKEYDLDGFGTFELAPKSEIYVDDEHRFDKDNNIL